MTDLWRRFLSRVGLETRAWIETRSCGADLPGNGVAWASKPARGLKHSMPAAHHPGHPVAWASKPARGLKLGRASSLSHGLSVAWASKPARGLKQEPHAGPQGRKGRVGLETRAWIETRYCRFHRIESCRVGLETRAWIETRSPNAASRGEDVAWASKPARGLKHGDVRGHVGRVESRGPRNPRVD